MGCLCKPHLLNLLTPTLGEPMKSCPECGQEVTGRADRIFCSVKCGNRARSRTHHAIHKDSPEWKEDQRERNRRHRFTPRGKYMMHKHRAKQDGVKFNISFGDWLSLWEPYLYREDGVRYCMCRTGDSGAYEIGNVRIDTAANNNREARGLPCV